MRLITLLASSLQHVRNQRFDPRREVLELGPVPPPGGAAPAGEVGRRSGGNGERVQRLRDHGEAEEGEDLEEVVRAGDEAEQAAPGDLVPSVAVVGPQPREEAVVVEVAGEADGEDEHAGAEQVNGGVREAAAEVLRVDHGGRADQVAAGDGGRRAQRHAPAVPVHAQHLEDPLEEVRGERGAEQLGARALDGARHREGRGGGEQRRGVGQQHAVPASQERHPAPLPGVPAGGTRHGVPELGVGHVVAAELGEARVRHGHERHRRHRRHVRRRRRRVQEREPHHPSPPPASLESRSIGARSREERPLWREVRAVWWTGALGAYGSRPLAVADVQRRSYVSVLQPTRCYLW
jgi:hypothetical protein